MALPPPDPSGRHRLSVRISTASGSIKVIAEARSDVVVTRGGQAESLADGVVEVRPARPSSSVDVRCPGGTDVVVGTASGGVELEGRLGAVRVTSASGSIRADSVTEADLRTASGSVAVQECDGRCRVSTKSGKVKVSVTGEADVSSVAGRITIERVDGTVDVRTVSGKVWIGATGHGPIGARTMSGSIKISLPRGVRPAVHMSGLRSVDCRCEAGDDVSVDVATISGAVEILPS
jgi:DUF4097 and DUF4098 domain-containing protein YvlB